MSSSDVAKQSAAVSEMAKEWPLIAALMGGTPKMREAATAFLPRWPNEAQDSYDARLQTATLFPAFRRTVSVMAGKPFSKPLTLSKDTPEQIVQWAKDIDREGVNLHAFAAERFQQVMSAGFGGILVEAPKQIKGATGGPPTAQEQKAAGIRPYWVRVNHDQILGWQLTVSNGGAQLTQLRIAECVTVPDGAYGEKESKRVRVLTPGAFEVFEEQEVAGKKVWVSIDFGVTGLAVIPFVPLYGVRKGFMRGAPPLLDLAYLNVKHWQSQSDQDTILHYARVPILFARMFGAETVLTISAGCAIKAEHEKADAKWVEHSGEAIGAGKESLKDLEEQMIQSGAELLVAKPGGRSATEDANDAEANKCDLQRMAETFTDALNLALYFTSLYSKLSKSGTVTLFSDYASRSLSDASAQLLVALQQAGIITKATVIREQQRRSVLSADIDPEKELALAGEEGPTPGNDPDPGDDA